MTHTYATLLLAVTMALTTAYTATAQQRRQASASTEWLKDAIQLKHDMLVQELELTKAQQSEFLPLYQQMEEEKYKANKEARDMAARIAASKEPVSDLEYAKAAQALSEVGKLNAQTEDEYFAKFEKILTKKQLFQLKLTEINFSRKMLTGTKRRAKAKARKQ